MTTLSSSELRKKNEVHVSHQSVESAFYADKQRNGNQKYNLEKKGSLKLTPIVRNKTTQYIVIAC